MNNDQLDPNAVKAINEIMKLRNKQQAAKSGFDNAVAAVTKARFDHLNALDLSPGERMAMIGEAALCYRTAERAVHVALDTWLEAVAQADHLRFITPGDWDLEESEPS